ncbi:MAG TPA: alpha/beta fold hydrolase [Planctomycetota bacterium]|nr:alpha/beta fold hydrolase [Planctomycetota bacterium]
MRESVLRAGRERALVGVATLPDGPARTGVVLLNAGLVHRVGPSRMWVALARRLAEQGHACLRIDFSGIGDSPDDADAARFETRAPRETQAAMDALQEAAAVARFTLVGLCSGAEIAFKTALEDPRVAVLVLVNAPRFLEEPSAALVARLEERQAARYYWRVALRNPRSWWKALRGRADLAAMTRAAFLRVLRRGGRSRAAEIPDSPDARAFRTLLRRGTRIHVVLSEGDWGEDYLDAILGEHFAEGGERIQRTIVPGCDHLLTPIASQEQLLAAVVRWAREWR